MDPESASLDPSVWGPLMAEAAQKQAALQSAPTAMAAAPGPGAGFGAMGGQGAGAPGASGDGSPGAADDAGSLTVEEIRALIQSGEISRDSATSLFSAMPGVGWRPADGRRPAGRWPSDERRPAGGR